LCYHPQAAAWLWNFDQIPFREKEETNKHPKAPNPPLVTELPDLLGLANPCPIAVGMEPFSTSVFKVLI